MVNGQHRFLATAGEWKIGSRDQSNDHAAEEGIHENQDGIFVDGDEGVSVDDALFGGDAERLSPTGAGVDVNGMPVGGLEPADGEPGDPSATDRWERRGLYMVRAHNIPRNKLFAPNPCLLDPRPCGMGCLDVVREPVTNDGEHPEGVRRENDDFWIGSKEFDAEPTPNEWIGEIRFELAFAPHARVLLVLGHPP